jgi:rubrerythrin
MGTVYPYKCNKCGYSATTSGGHDHGMLRVTDTYICKYCKEIVDVAVGELGRTFSQEDLLIKKNKGESVTDFYACPICGSQNHMD